MQISPSGESGVSIIDIPIGPCPDVPGFFWRVGRTSSWQSASAKSSNGYYAQTFVAGGEHLRSIDLSLWAALGPGEGKYHLLITTVKALAPNQFQPDQILAEVNGVPEPLDANPDFHKVHIDLGGVTLVEGQTYAFVIDAIVTQRRRRRLSRI